MTVFLYSGPLLSGFNVVIKMLMTACLQRIKNISHYDNAIGSIIIIRGLITCAMSEYMTESEARAVARWDVGSCLRMVRKTKPVGFEPVFESLHSWSISYGGWDFIPNLGAQ